MKKLLAIACIAAFASPAFAAKVTNLDDVPHVVQFESAGVVREETVAPGKSVLFPRYDGLVSLKGGTPAQSTVTSDGVLQGVIGAQRSSRIPSAPGDEFVIWKGGKLSIQRRMKSFMGQN